VGVEGLLSHFVCMYGWVSVLASLFVGVCVFSLTILRWPPFCFLSCVTLSLSLLELRLSLWGSSAVSPCPSASAFRFRFLITLYTLLRNENVLLLLFNARLN